MGAKDHPHRSAIGNVQTDDMGDNLAIVLASDFEPGCDSEELDESETWKQEAVDKTNRVLDAIHAIYEPQLAALRKRVEELEGALGDATAAGRTALGWMVWATTAKPGVSCIEGIDLIFSQREKLDARIDSAAALLRAKGGEHDC